MKSPTHYLNIDLGENDAKIAKRLLASRLRREAQMEESQYKDASGVESKDGRFYVVKIAP